MALKRAELLKRNKTVLGAYRSGMSAPEISKKYGYKIAACYKTLRDNGIHPRKRRINENFFENIDTEEKAYFLGFLTGDGGISEGKRVSLCLSVKDIDSIEKFKTSLQSEHPIGIVKEKRLNHGGNKARLVFSCKKMAEDLSKFGIVQNKTFTVRPCETIPKNLIHHYWRGNFDGDGCIFKSKYFQSDKIGWTVGLAGNKFMIDGFREFINPKIGSRASTLHVRNKAYSVSYSGVSCPQEVIKILYKDATIFMDRKKKLADELLSIKPNVIFKPRRKPLTNKEIKEIQKLLKNNAFQKDIAKKFNISGSQISEINTGRRWGKVA